MSAEDWLTSEPTAMEAAIYLDEIDGFRKAPFLELHSTVDVLKPGHPRSANGALNRATECLAYNQYHAAFPLLEEAMDLGEMAGTPEGFQTAAVAASNLVLLWIKWPLTGNKTDDLVFFQGKPMKKWGWDVPFTACLEAHRLAIESGLPQAFEAAARFPTLFGLLASHSRDIKLTHSFCCAAIRDGQESGTPLGAEYAAKAALVLAKCLICAKADEAEIEPYLKLAMECARASETMAGRSIFVAARKLQAETGERKAHWIGKPLLLPDHWLKTSNQKGLRDKIPEVHPANAAPSPRIPLIGLASASSPRVGDSNQRASRHFKTPEHRAPNPDRPDIKARNESAPFLKKTTATSVGQRHAAFYFDPSPLARKAIMDVSNLLGAGRHDSLEPIVAVKEILEDQGFAVLGVLDQRVFNVAFARYRAAEAAGDTAQFQRGKKYVEMWRDLEATGKFTKTSSKGHEADSLALSVAHEEGGIIVTESERYRGYVEQYPWIETEPQRIVRVTTLLSVVQFRNGE